MKRMLVIFLVGLVSLVALPLNPVFALEGRTYETATEDYLAHLPYTWTPTINNKVKVNGVYFRFEGYKATPMINIFLDSNKGATYDMLLATEYLAVPGYKYWNWIPTYDVIIEKADSVRVVLGANSSLVAATSVGILIKGELQ